MPRRLQYGFIVSGGYNTILLFITRSDLHVIPVNTLELRKLRYRDMILLTIKCKQIGPRSYIQMVSGPQVFLARIRSYPHKGRRILAIRASNCDKISC